MVQLCPVHKNLAATGVSVPQLQTQRQDGRRDEQYKSELGKSLPVESYAILGVAGLVDDLLQPVGYQVVSAGEQT